MTRAAPFAAGPDLLDLLEELDRPTLHLAASTPLCEWIGEPVPPVEVGDLVTLCTASRQWRVTGVYDDGVVALTPARGDKWLQPLTAHGQHVQRVPAEPHGLVGPCRHRLDVLPLGMRAVLCACGAKARDEAQHARHAARRQATGCDCGSGCPHDLPETTP